MTGAKGGEAAVRSVGLLSIGEIGAVFRNRRDDLRQLAGAIANDERRGLARYLRGGTIVFASMEHTRDVIDGGFECPGGSGILTDGKYYWRGDAADYVEHHGIRVLDEFVEHARQLGWEAPPVSPDRVLEVDRYLIGLANRDRSP